MRRREFLGAVAAAPLALRAGLGGRAKEHVVVVGAGAFGGWSALALLRAGMRVTLVDAWGAGNSRASSGGETRVIRAVYNGVALYSEMAARAMVLWREAEQQWNRPVLTRTGALWMFSGADDYARNSIGPMKAVGLSLEEISVAESARRFPQMSFNDVRTVFYEPEAGFLQARVACELVRDAFVREGGEYVRGLAGPAAPIGGRMSGIAVSTGNGVRADKYVFACGPWMGQLFPDVIGRRIVATKQEVFFFGPPAGDTRFDVRTQPTWVYIGDRLSYGVPNHGRGLKIADDTAGEEVDPTTMERTPSAKGLARAREILDARFPAMSGAPLLESRVCQYEASSDGHFLVDRHPQLENVWLVGGGSGHGFKMGPALGEYVAALVQESAAVHPMFAYARLVSRGQSR